MLPDSATKSPVSPLIRLPQTSVVWEKVLWQWFWCGILQPVAQGSVLLAFVPAVSENECSVCMSAGHGGVYVLVCDGL